MQGTARTVCAAIVMGLLAGCAQGIVPQARNVNIPAPRQADQRPNGVNEVADSVIYLPLGRDVLVPEAVEGDPLPDKEVGPFELRGETLGGALQLILADVDVPIAFETDQGLSRTITVANLRGKLEGAVTQVCALADLYCSYEHGALVIKDRQTFTVTVPPVGNTTERQAMLTNVAAAIAAITGSSPVTDPTSRTIIYDATSRTADKADRYFQRLRASTALIVYETYVWEVSLDSAHSAGIQWDQIESFKNGFGFGVSVSGATSPELGTPISIGLPTKGEVNLTTGDVFEFISTYGAVKTISQPQLTMLSGSNASLRVVDTQNYVSEITRTLVDNQTTVSTTADSVDSGFTLNISSSWDNATVYGSVDILLEEVRAIDTFDDNPDAIVQLPQTTQRQVQTQVRVRPGDSLLIAGLVRETDNFDKSGIGIEKPIIPTSRGGGTSNVELVFLVKPRVIVFTETSDKYQRAPVVADTPVPAPVGRPVAYAASNIPEPITPLPAETLPAEPMPAAAAPAAPMIEPVQVAPVTTPVTTSGTTTIDQLFDKPVALTPAEDTLAVMPTAPAPAAVTADPIAAPATVPSVSSSEMLLQSNDTAVTSANAATPLPGDTQPAAAASAATSTSTPTQTYQGPITPSFTGPGTTVSDPLVNGQHRPASSTLTTPARPVPPVYDTYGSAGKGV